MASKRTTPVEPLTFAMSACQYPAGVLDSTAAFVGEATAHPVRAHGPADCSLAELVAWARNQVSRPAFWLATGDSVYVDATAGLFDPATTGEATWNAYVKLFLMPLRAAAVAKVLRFALLDDHEVSDNWEPSNNDSRNARLQILRDAGVRAFQAERDMHTPYGALWFCREFSGHGVFFGDTRSEREARGVLNVGVAKLLGDLQFLSLKSHLSWWQQCWPDSYRFIATPSIFLPRRLTTVEHEHRASALRSDAWDGYPASLHALLAYIADAQISRCVFLSGDEHLGCIATATVRRIDTNPMGPEVRLWSIHVGAMYAPYPFANSTPADLADAGDEWEFVHDGKTYRCRVDQVWFPERPRLPGGPRPPGMSDGFVTVEVVPKLDGEAELNVTYRYANSLAARAHSVGPVGTPAQDGPIDQVWQWRRP